MSGIRFAALLLLAGLSVPAQDFKDLQNKVKDFTLANGLRVVVVERHDAPLVAFRTQIGVGSANDPAGSSGMAYLLERVGNQGSDNIGSKDPAAEKKAIDALEEAVERLAAEKNKGRAANDVKITSLELEVQKALDIARSWALPNEFRRVLEENGIVGVGSSTTPDFTERHCVAPANRLEFWFLTESQRLLHPAFRSFYPERSAALDERARLETNAAARMAQALSAAAFTAHPYRAPVFGWTGELGALRLNEARLFFNRYYVPANITVTLSGDVNPEEARRLAERYLGPIPARPLPPLVRTLEPPQTGPRSVVLQNSVQPLIAVAFKRTDQYDRNDPVFDIIQMILAGGRGAWLQKELVENQRIAARVTAQATFPAGKYPHLFGVVIAPAPGHTVQENETAMTAVLARLQNEKVDDLTLARAKAQARVVLADRLGDNTGIAQMISSFASSYGDWRALFSAAEALQKVTADQVQIAALTYLIPAKRTSVLMVPPEAGQTPKGGAE